MSRRSRFRVFSFVMLAMILASIIFLNLIVSQSPKRFDVTATGEHKLSERTTRLLAALPGKFSILIWADFTRVNPAARETVVDLIEQFRRNATQLEVSSVDTSTTTGQATFASVLTQLAERDKQGILTQGRADGAVITSVRSFAQVLESTAPAKIQALAQTLNDPAVAQAVASRAAAVQTTAKELIKLATNAESLLATDAASCDAAARTLQDALASPLQQFSIFIREVSRLGESSTDARVSAAAKDLVSSLSTPRDSLASAVDMLAKTPRPALARVADALKNPRGILVIGPADLGLIALDFDELFPATPSARADTRRNAEELFSTAIGSLSVPNKPIVVLTHAESQPLLTSRARLFDALAAHFSRRAIDLVEYSVITQPEPPRPEDLDPTRTRPIIFLVLSPDSSVPAAGPSDKPGAERALLLGKALSKLAAAGASICLNVNPSLIPLSEQADPVTIFAIDFGLRIDSARPIVQVTNAAGRPTFAFDRVIQPLNSTHPITTAIRGLPTFVGFPISVEHTRPTDGSEVQVTDLYAIDGGSSWAEHEWISIWQTSPNKRNDLAPPTLDPAKDNPRGPFVVAAASERTRPSLPAQRLVFVGSNNWFADFITQATETVDGRVIRSFPGNLELMDASIDWLAHQEALIAPAPDSQAIAIIQPLANAQITLLRAILIIALPASVLLLGVIYRCIRG